MTILVTLTTQILSRQIIIKTSGKTKATTLISISLSFSTLTSPQKKNSSEKRMERSSFLINVDQMLHAMFTLYSIVKMLTQVL